MPQAILLQDVEQLGERGAVVDVSKGFLRNFLIPRKLAEPATRGAPGWRELLRDLPDVVRSFEEGHGRLVELAEECPEVRHLFHDDLINRNVLVQGDRISAVLDWGSSKYGDFVYDIANLVFYKPWFPQWHGIDFAAEALAHYERIGLAVPKFAERIKCYSLRIALDGIAYSAFRERWGEVELRARRALEIARERTG